MYLRLTHFYDSKFGFHVRNIIFVTIIELGGTTNAFYFLICITEKLI